MTLLQALQDPMVTERKVLGQFQISDFERPVLRLTSTQAVKMFQTGDSEPQLIDNGL